MYNISNICVITLFNYTIFPVIYIKHLCNNTLSNYIQHIKYLITLSSYTQHFQSSVWNTCVITHCQTIHTICQTMYNISNIFVTMLSNHAQHVLSYISNTCVITSCQTTYRHNIPNISVITLSSYAQHFL